MAEVRRQWADHLYSKGDLDGAMTQYMKTIGHLAPSYVILKYLDAAQVLQLATYLEELHTQGRHESGHIRPTTSHPSCQMCFIPEEPTCMRLPTRRR